VKLVPADVMYAEGPPRWLEARQLVCACGGQEFHVVFIGKERLPRLRCARDGCHASVAIELEEKRS
jgi:hypothetical protein